MAGAPVDNEFLVQASLYLGATAVAVPVFKKLKLGTILGFLAAGIILGPSALGWLKVEEGVFHVAELGVVLFLFVIGLELSFGRLWSLRQTIFGLGLSQMVVTGAALSALFIWSGVFPMGAGIIAGFGLACSSTAFALSLLQERREMNSPHGTRAFSVLLLQDVAVIPLLAAIPIVAAQAAGGEDGVAVNWVAIGQAAGVVIAIILVGRFLLNPFFKIVAVSGSREAFTAAALFVVAATSLGVAEVGLSMALGAFLAGVMLAESSFRHQIEADIEPFRELLLGLFFIGVGMQLDLGVLLDSWWIVLSGAIGLIAIKSVILFVLARTFGAETPTALKTAGVLSQGGEFGFVVFSLGVGAGLFAGDMATILSAVITLSMIATPIIMMSVSRIQGTTVGELTPAEEAEAPGSVLVVGFGRIGQVVTQVLRGSGVTVTAIDNDPKRIEMAAQFGTKVYFGNGADIHLLLQAGALNADAVVFALDARAEVGTTVAALREKCPNIRILVRAYDRLHEIELMDSEPDFIIREMLESAITLSEKTLEYIGFSDDMIADITAEHRERDLYRFLSQRLEGAHANIVTLSIPFQAFDSSNVSGRLWGLRLPISLRLPSFGYGTFCFPACSGPPFGRALRKKSEGFASLTDVPQRKPCGGRPAPRWRSPSSMRCLRRSSSIPGRRGGQRSTPGPYPPRTGHGCQSAY